MFSVSILSAFSCNLLTVNTFQSVTTINGKMLLFVSVSFAERDGSQSLFFFLCVCVRGRGRGRKGHGAES